MNPSMREYIRANTRIRADTPVASDTLQIYSPLARGVARSAGVSAICVRDANKFIHLDPPVKPWNDREVFKNRKIKHRHPGGGRDLRNE